MFIYVYINIYIILILSIYILDSLSSISQPSVYYDTSPHFHLRNMFTIYRTVPAAGCIVFCQTDSHQMTTSSI